LDGILDLRLSRLPPLATDRTLLSSSYRLLVAGQIVGNFLDARLSIVSGINATGIDAVLLVSDEVLAVAFVQRRKEATELLPSTGFRQHAPLVSAVACLVASSVLALLN